MKEAKPKKAAREFRYDTTPGADPVWELADTGAAYVVDQVRAGLPAIAFTGVQARLGILQAEFARFTGISHRTLMRRRVHGGRLTPAESAPVMRYALLHKRAADLLGGEEPAAHWLKTPKLALGGETPLAYAGTEFGAQEVEQLLGRLAHGVFS